MENIEYLSDDSFCWSRWRSFSLFGELGLRASQGDVFRFRAILRHRIIGYRQADGLRSRPKANHYAVMFDDWTWCHLTEKEFEKICV